ncbi:unnamed protein product [Effrenium voratum]|nr:unnamed protein product [Effrenium voratum]
MESSLGHGRGNDTHKKWGTPSTNIFYRDVLKCFAVAEFCFSSRKRPHLRPEVPARVCGDRQALAELLPAPAPAAPTAPVAPAAPGACHVTIEGVDLAQSALEDFASSYFMFHGLETSPGNLLKFLPFLGFLEGHLYCLDQQNEDSLTAAAADLQAPLPEDPFGPLREVLKAGEGPRFGAKLERTWLTPRLEQELAQGARFWSLERKICRALRGEGRLLQAEAEEALRLKSFDYRAMNLLLYRMRGEEPNEAFMDFLVTSEVLVEIGDDLVDYYEDVERNSFNIYRCCPNAFKPLKPVWRG